MVMMSQSFIHQGFVSLIERYRISTDGMTSRVSILYSSRLCFSPYTSYAFPVTLNVSILYSSRLCFSRRRPLISFIFILTSQSFIHQGFVSLGNRCRRKYNILNVSILYSSRLCFSLQNCHMGWSSCDIRSLNPLFIKALFLSHVEKIHHTQITEIRLNPLFIKALFLSNSY